METGLKGKTVLITGASCNMGRLAALAFAREGAQYDVTANCIAPGTIEVERDAFQKEKPLRASQPIRRMDKPHEVVSLVLYLASDNAGFITGQCYMVKGGMYFQ